MKINEAHRVEMKRRRIGDLSDYFVKADIHLKPKFKELFDANSKSLATADPALLLKVWIPMKIPFRQVVLIDVNSTMWHRI